MAKPIPNREASSVQPLQFLLDGVRYETTRLGHGAYAEVYKASVPCAAKALHTVLEDARYPRNRERFEQECCILGECFHPNIVRFFGVSVDPETGRTALLMELMTETLTQFLEVRYKDPRLLPYCLQLHISHDIASGVKYLHSKSILHRDLSSNNVLMKCGVEITAKLSDFGASKLELRDSNVEHSSQTECPGTAVYMPPEAFHSATRYNEKFDSFQMGVLMLQIATKRFPKPSERIKTKPNPRVPAGYSCDPDPTPEKQRRENHLRLLREPEDPSCHGEHPLLDHPILDCLEDRDEKRPSANLILEHLTNLLSDQRYLRDCKNKGITPRVVQEGLKVSDRVGVHSSESDRVQTSESDRAQALREENMSLRAQLEREKQELQRQLVQMQQLGMMGSENEQLRRQLESEIQALHHEKQQLAHTNGELRQQLLARETHWNQQLLDARNQLEIQARECQARIDGLADRETARSQTVISNLHTQLREKNEEYRLKCVELERVIPNHICRIVSGLRKTTTANHPVSVEMELCDSDNNPRNVSENTPLRAMLVSSLQADYNPVDCDIKVLEKRFNVSYETSLPGQYQLMVQLSRREIYRSPPLSVYPDPRPPNVLVPHRFIENHKKPWSIAINQQNHEIFVGEQTGNKISVYDIDAPDRVKRCLPESPNVTMVKPTGIALDENGDIYVTSEHKLQKFSRETHVILKSVGVQRGEQNDEFHFPAGLAVHGGEVYVCDQKNGRIQVFDLDLKYVRTVISRVGQHFDDPSDVAFDDRGRMYVAEYGTGKILVLSAAGENLQVIGEGQQLKPESVHVVNDYLYVSDFNREHHSAVAVFHVSGKYITSFGRRGYGEGEWFDPRGIASCEGRIYVCGSEDGHVHIF